MKALHETIADIAYTAGFYRFYTGDSRADMQTFVSLAKKFEEKYEGVNWNELEDSTHPDYMEAVDTFVKDELKLVSPISFDYPNGATESWDNLEIEAIRDDGSGTVEPFEPSENDLPPQYYSLYTHRVNGSVMCIADVPSEDDAVKLRELIERAVRTFTQTSNTDFINIKEKLNEFLKLQLSNSWNDSYRTAIESVINFVNQH